MVVEPDSNHWALAGDPGPLKLDPAVRADIEWIVNRFGNWSTNDLLDYVYDRYPAYTVLCKRMNRPDISRPLATPAVYTAGYEGLTVDEFLDLLVQTGIRALVDVRSNPVARRYGFHRSTLDRLCGKLGIQYSHHLELGIPSHLRQDLQTQADRDRLFELYGQTTLTTEAGSIEALARRLRESPTVFLCQEARACECHRSHLARALAGISGLPVVHLPMGANHG